MAKEETTMGPVIRGIYAGFATVNSGFHYEESPPRRL
jgi:hypothetical protein